MSWSFAQARYAAAQAHTAPLGRQAMATIRPRSVILLLRARAPLPLLLYVAGRDGLVVTQDNGGYAVIQRPLAHRPYRSGGYGLRLLRWIDRRWDFLVFAGPPVTALLVAALTALVPATRVASLLILFAGVLWVCVLFLSMLAYQVRWMAGMGAPSGPGRPRAAESLPGNHWSVPLVHQWDPDRIDDLIRLLTERLTELVRTDLQASAGDQARVGSPELTETLVVLISGITTEAARTAMAESLRTVRDYPSDGDVIMVAAPARLDRVAKPSLVPGGSFLLLYIVALTVVVAVCALFVADAEAYACGPGSCAGRPATYQSALRWLLQRLLFSDPPGLAPATTRVVVLGWLMSLASGMFFLVAFVAGRQEIRRNRETRLRHEAAMTELVTAARVLILVVTPGERDAVIAAVRRRVGRDPVIDHIGERVGYALGSVSGTELMLVQAAEQGTLTAAGMLLTAKDAIAHCRPDYVILTGICYGLRPDEGQQLGDIVVARRVHNIDHQKVTDGYVIQRGVNVGCSPGLLDRFQAGGATWVGPQVHIGTVLTANRVVDSEQLVHKLRKEFPDAIAGEMEGTGVHEATTQGEKPDWIMVKAISDWGYGKADDGQPTAARSAAEFVVHVVAGAALRRRRRHGPAGDRRLEPGPQPPGRRL